MSSNTTTIDQNILDMIFGPIYPTYQLPQEKKSIAHDLMIEYMNDFVLYLMDKFNCSDEVAVNMFFYILMRFDDEDEYYYSSSFNLIIDFLSTLEEEEPDRVNEFMNSLIQYSDTKVLTDSILSYMEKSGMSPKETVKAFSNYNDATGGICSYAVFSKNICDQLTDEEFREHFGFEKYVEFNGEKIYNPLLLADMVFETNRMDRSDEWYSPNFVEENGKWYRKDDGELKDNALSYTSGFFEIDVANYYLGLKGLRVTKLSEEEINGMVISYNPDVSSDISRSDYLKLVVEAALNEGYSIRLGMCYGVQFTNIDTGYREYIGFDSGHDVNVIGTCEEGFVIATWGEYYVLPYNYADAVHEGYQQVNYSIIKIEEIGE